MPHSCDDQITYRVSKKTHFQNNAGATVHWLNHHLPAPLVSGDWFFGRFLLRLSRIKRPQVMSMVKFSPIALNFRYDFVLLVHFWGEILYISLLQPPLRPLCHSPVPRRLSLWSSERCEPCSSYPDVLVVWIWGHRGWIKLFMSLLFFAFVNTTCASYPLETWPDSQ